MIETLLKEREERAVPNGAPYLSYSRVNKYLLCPEQYRLYYIENLRLKFPSANLVFGQVVHFALASLFNKKEDAVKTFLGAWDDLKGVELTYGRKESWEKLKSSGEALLEKFLKEELSRISQVKAVEKVFKLNISSLDLPFIGVIDLIAETERNVTIVDYKTAKSDYGDHESAMSDQLTAYKLAEPEAEEVALWVLIKTKKPRIEWYPSKRTPDQLTEYLAKIGYVAREIVSGHFYKRKGMWCNWCDFLPVCLGDKKKIEETLVQVR